MNEAPILVHNVTRSFDWLPVVKDLSFAVKSGNIYGFLGRNGSGKTTTIRMLEGLIKPIRGEVRIMGNDPFTMRAEERQWLGYMSKKAVIPFFTTVKSVLKLGQTFYPTWDC